VSEVNEEKHTEDGKLAEIICEKDGVKEYTSFLRKRHKINNQKRKQRMYICSGVQCGVLSMASSDNSRYVFQ
jgi:hypothetical protein